MAQVNGWTHEYMLSMPKRALFRYYGVWLIRKIKEDEEREAREREEQNRERRNNPNTQWKTL
jgi:hypothetical protein